MSNILTLIEQELNNTPEKDLDNLITDILKLLPDKSGLKRNIPEVFFYSEEKMYYIGMGSGRLFEKPYNEKVVNQIKRLKRLKWREIGDLTDHFLKQ